jgi:plastocyanin
MRRLSFVLAAALLLFTPAAAWAADQTVTIDNFTFAPKDLKVAVGTKVTWINRDDIPHTVVSSDGPQSFKSPPLDTDDKFSMQFDRRGTYHYFCSIHPMMTATVIVE